MDTESPLQVRTDGLVDRVKAILLKPKEEWPKIAAEPTTPGDILTRYAIPLIAIGPVASFIGGQVFGFGALGITFRPGLIAGLSTAIVTFVMSIVALVVVTFIAEFLAPKFGGEASRPQAFKWVAYGATASWVGAVFGLIPSLGLLGLVAALYSLYLFYLGATPVMKVPQDKAAGFTAVTVVCAIVAMVVVSAVTSAVAGVFGAVPTIASATDDGKLSGTLSIPGVGSIDTAKMQQATDRMQKMANGEIKPLTPEQMSPLLPKQIGSYAQASTSSTAMGGMGSEADATYKSGDRSFELKVTDMAALGGFTGMVAAMNVETNRQDANGYERVHKDGNDMVSEKWNNSESSGSYGTSVNNRFFIEAEGNAASIDELKAAVAAVDKGKLAGLAQ
ncbi:MAG: YIP1 family protein [Porphyrobacter sp.]|nr:YIP1 family protein [Porphyrobacter sp.]